MDELLTRLRQLSIVPVIVIDDPLAALPLAQALLDGGLPCAEITFRTPRAVEALHVITQECPEILAGAGTVLTVEQAAQARTAGSRFVVTPGFNPAVVDYCLGHAIPVFPGVCTPTEIEAALQRGISVVKFFPAEPMGGASFLRAISAPYSGVEFIPTGGIKLDHLPAYLSLEIVVACGGSWIAPPEWIRAKQFDRIRQETEQAVRVARMRPRGR
jgi:2-dehydro-3-deoxyphosphogluconate aldolase / (4S)-4-hydroxy-2-oxoglutarate aldolase